MDSILERRLGKDSKSVKLICLPENVNRVYPSLKLHMAQEYLQLNVGCTFLAYEDIKACHRQARISGMTSFAIGSAATYVVLRTSKIFEKQSKYVPLVCLGVGACCGYIKSILVIQEYKNMVQKLEASKNPDHVRARIMDSNKSDSSVSNSKYGDEGFFLDEKDK